MEKRKFTKVEFPNIEITFTHTPLHEIREECKCFFTKLNEIQYKAKCCDLLERYYYFHHEYMQLLNSVGEYCDKTKYHEDLMGYSRSKFNEEFNKLKLKIRISYGAHDVKQYLRTENCRFLTNPKLLGLAFLLFNP